MSHRHLLPLALMLLAAPSAGAEDGGFIWQSGFGQGTSEAAVPNASGGEFRVYCRGGSDGNAGLLVRLEGAGSLTTERTQVVVSVDGVAEGWDATVEGEGAATTFVIEAFNLASMTPLDDLVTRLMAAKALQVEVPAAGLSSEFSLRGSAEALAGLMEPCVAAKS